MKTEIRTITTPEEESGFLAVISSGELFPLRVTGSSMRPFLKEGRDTVWLGKVTDLRRGTIIFFRRADGSFALHRIRKILPDKTLIVNGDAQTWCETVRPENTVAEAVRVSRENGKTFSLKSPSFRFLSALWYPTRRARHYIFRIFG